ncbi:Sodium/hydrogen exchanger family-domain-containing protein [Aspergillus multicolor]|uniref:cation:proton antiporter n=1 Tax=Aspergillus multicolor TaxID=41759 RepID=UPI003CCD2D39
MANSSSLPYHEPPISTLLNQTGLLLALNLINTLLDRLLYCGLIGQLFIGILWGTPGAGWLSRDVETVIQQLGYLGLIMLVYEGGLSTSLPSLRANLALSVAVALTGIGVPMALSFVLMRMVGASPLQAFAASAALSAALSATSLGTTFTILSTTGLIQTRLGTVTTAAAMLDDVVGLVMVQIISNLGSSGDEFSAVTVVRPLFVSLGFGVGVVLVCRFLLRPVILGILGHKEKLPAFMGTRQFAFLAYTALLVGLVAGATYAGTSSLFAAYLAGVVSEWVGGLIQGTLAPIPAPATGADSSGHEVSSQQVSAESASIQSRTSQPLSQKGEEISAVHIYEIYCQAPVNRILIPMFFASIGFAIPITEMFEGGVVWRGFVYAVLMTFGKMCTGLWLVRFSPSSGLANFVRILKTPLAYVSSCIRRPNKAGNEKEKGSNRAVQSERTGAREKILQNDSSTGPQTTSGPTTSGDTQEKPPNIPREVTNASRDTSEPVRQPSVSSLPPKPKSLYPASILALAMVARGEIGYLIASLAESNGIFGQSSDLQSGGSSETYLIVVWAISLCTLIGPICVGTLVRRVKNLQKLRAERESGGADPLGVWGI